MKAVTVTFPPDRAAYYLNIFRKARYAAQKDAEDFLSICLAIEDFGGFLLGKRKSLNESRGEILKFLDADEDGDFYLNYERLREARNGASHEGPYARNAAALSIDVSIEIEAALMKRVYKAKHIMSKGVEFAQPFDSLTKLRLKMLENSYSYLPFEIEGKFYFVSDLDIAKAFAKSSNRSERESASFMRLIAVSDIACAEVISEDMEILEILKKDSWPLLVKNDAGYISGVITAFDLL